MLTSGPVGHCVADMDVWAMSASDRKCVDKNDSCCTSRDVMITSGDNCLDTAAM